MTPKAGESSMSVDLSTVANGVYTVMLELDSKATQQPIIVNR